MGRKKKIKSEDTVIEVDTTTSAFTGTTNPGIPSDIVLNNIISPFSEDFGRADMNLLRDKVNEIIDFINKHNA